MLSFIRIGGSHGVWANRDKALEYLWQGYPVYTDETMTEEVTEADLEAMVEEGQISLTSKTAEG